MSSYRNSKGEWIIPMDCEGGCTAKIPPDELESLLSSISYEANANVLSGLPEGDDAGIYIVDQQGYILTTDFFPPICEEAFIYGEIAAANAFSDVWAVGGEVLAAMNITLFPGMGLPLEILKDILAGGAKTAKRAGVVIIGGHTISNVNPVYGMAVWGKLDGLNFYDNRSFKEGDLLILTKPLGTGVAMAAKRIQLNYPETYRQAIESMRQLNMEASRICRAFKDKVHSATDITGFGLSGHAARVAKASQVEIEFWHSKIPSFDKIKELINLSCLPGATFSNLKFIEKKWRIKENVPDWIKKLLTDPQSSGGLLISAEENIAPQLLQRLQEAGYEKSAVIGCVNRRSSRGDQIIVK